MLIMNNQQLSNFNDTQELMIIKKIIKTKEINEIVFGEREKGECKWFMLFCNPTSEVSFADLSHSSSTTLQTPLPSLKSSEEL